MTHTFFGLQTVPIPPAAAEQAGLPEGLYVQAVTPGGPAATAGLRPDDVITKIDGNPVAKTADLFKVLDRRRIGDTVELEITRGSSHRTVKITLEAAR